MSHSLFTDQYYRQLTSLPAGEYDNCIFENCELANTDLSGLIFADCIFRNCDLSNAKLEETALKTVEFTGCKLLGLHFEICRDFLFKVTFNNCNLELATFLDWSLKGTAFRDCKLKEIDFTGADLREADFSGSNLRNAVFERTDLRKSNFTSARNYSFSAEDNRIKGARFSVAGLPGLLAEYGIVVE